MEFRQLATFAAVVQTGSFTRAAAALGYVQSSVTAHIQALEQELGLPLFDRLGRQVALTPAGRRFLGYSNRLLVLAEEARTSVGMPNEPLGTLTLSAPESICVYQLPRLLRAARDQFPQLRLIFRPTPSADLVRAVRDGALDLAFMISDPLVAPRPGCELLRQEAIALVAAPTHPLVAAASVVPADLADLTILVTEIGCAYRVQFERVLHQAQVVPQQVLEFSSIEAIKQCVAAEMGVAVLPHMTVARELADGRLVALPWAGSGFDVVTQMVWHPERWQSPALQALLGLARALLHGPALTNDGLG